MTECPSKMNIMPCSVFLWTGRCKFDIFDLYNSVFYGVSMTRYKMGPQHWRFEHDNRSYICVCSTISILIDHIGVLKCTHHSIFTSMCCPTRFKLPRFWNFWAKAYPREYWAHAILGCVHVRSFSLVLTGAFRLMTCTNHSACAFQCCTTLFKLLRYWRCEKQCRVVVGLRVINSVWYSFSQ